MKKIVITAVALSLAACTSATREKVNTLPVSQPSISPVLAQSAEKTLKRVVAIARFSDETKRGNGFLLDQNTDRLGKQASDILSARLTDTNKFIMLERADLDKLIAENNFSGEQMQKTGSDFLIVGSVSEFGRSTTSEVGVFSRNKIQLATATVNVRLINTKTGQIVYAEEATGEARVEANTVLGVGERAAYDTAINDKALSAAISKLVSNISENLLDAPWQAYLVGQQDGFYLMTGGQTQGLKVGDSFKVLTQGKQVKNPQTGMMISLPGKQQAVLRVSAFVGEGANELSLCELVSGQISAAELTELVVQEQGK